MPLLKSKSKAAFGHNVGAEMKAGKPQKQALAIAYSVKRKARMSRGGQMNEKLHPMAKYASGGQIPPNHEPTQEQDHDGEMKPYARQPKREYGYEKTDADKRASAMRHPDEGVEMPKDELLMPRDPAYMPDEQEPHRYAEGGQVGEHEQDEPRVISGAQFLSDETDDETPFHSSESDESELKERYDGSYDELSDLDNRKGHDEPEYNKTPSLDSIIRNLRMKHMGRR